MNGPMLLILLVVATGCSAVSPPHYSMSSADGSYSYSFDTGVEGGGHSREESRSADGVVSGRFSYNDPTGYLRSVQYRAGQDFGYEAMGDVGPVGAPKAQLPIYGVKELKGDAETEVSTEASRDETGAPDQSQDSPKEEGDKTEEQDPGFFVLGLGGKRRLERPSDTGKLNVPPEQSRPHTPLVYYSMIGYPYGYYSRRPVYVPYAFPHFPYVPYAHTIRSPFNKGFSSQTSFQTY